MFAPIAASMSAGTQLNRMLDSLGLPDKVGDMMGAALDAKMGNSAGMMRNLFDGFSKMSTRQLDFGALGGLLPAFGSMMSPHKMLGRMAPAMLGAFAGGALALPMSMLAGGPMGVAGNFLGRIMQGLGGGILGMPHSQGGGVTGADSHARSGKANPLDTGGGDIRSIVNNPNLSIEEKMSLALMKMAEKQEAKLEAQLDKMSRPQGKAEAGGGLGGGGILGGGGLLGGIASLGKGILGAATGGMLSGVLDGASGGGSQATGNAGGRQESEQVAAQKLQMIQQKMSRLLDTLSNIMKSFHQTSSTAIRNIN